MPETVAPLEIPEGLSPDAADLFEDVMITTPNLTPSQYAQLMIACRQLSLASRAEQAIGEEWTVIGTRGAMIANPLVSEVRQMRAAASQALRAAAIDRTATGASAAGSSLAGRRWRK